MDYHVISSGSKGNAVKIHDVLVDCGVSFAQLKDFLYDIKYLLITHVHMDHLKPKTFNAIRKLFPKITTIGNYEVGQVVELDIISNEGFAVETDDYTFFPFKCVHDVLTYGYTFEINDKKIIYVTDTGSLQFAPSGPYDYLFLESNHDEKKLEEIRKKPTKGYDPFESGKRHLSTQEARKFYYLNRRSKDSELIELHKSKRFY
jgi:phosphoribosyl 1,2-cyclic phosphodiesterase